MSTTSSMTSTMQQASPLSSSTDNNALKIFAQRLNNSAALCIEVGRYDRAIFSLQRALRLSEKYTKAEQREREQGNSSIAPLSTRECSLDECIAFSDINNIHINASTSNPGSPARLTAAVHAMANASAISADNSNSNDQESNVVRHGNKRRRVEIASVESNANGMKTTDVDNSPSTAQAENSTLDSDTNLYYVYNRPIRVPRQDHEIGSVLFLIILFNLALAHHLKASLMSASLPSDDPHYRKTVKKALMLYQLVLEYWFKLQQKEQASLPCFTKSYNSLRFRMILQNNLGELYQKTENPTKEHECLQDLLSTVLVVTDQTRGAGSRTLKRDLEGFLANTAVLTLHNQCAEAA